MLATFVFTSRITTSVCPTNPLADIANEIALSHMRLALPFQNALFCHFNIIVKLDAERILDTRQASRIMPVRASNLPSSVSFPLARLHASRHRALKNCSVRMLAYCRCTLQLADDCKSYDTSILAALTFCGCVIHSKM